MRRVWLTRIREAKEMSRAEAAKRSRLSKAFYDQIENGTRNPSVHTAQRIAIAIGFDWTLFFTPNECESNTKRGERDEVHTG